LIKTRLPLVLNVYKANILQVTSQRNFLSRIRAQQCLAAMNA